MRRLNQQTRPFRTRSLLCHPRTRVERPRPTRWRVGVALLFVSMLCGCGTMNNRNATEQLLVSDAVDRSISQIDFTPLGGRKVYLDTEYLRHVGSVGFVNSAYIVSSLRERMIGAHCVLQDVRDQADYIVEVRVGALGTDGHEVNYGFPASNAVNSTASVLTGTPLLPVLPEISLAKKDERRAAAKIGVFAYQRETKEPVWHPGMAKGESLAKSTWVLGAGPFQQGTIYDSTQFAGAPLEVKPQLWAGRSKPLLKPEWLKLPQRHHSTEQLANHPTLPSELAEHPSLPSTGEVTNAPSSLDEVSAASPSPANAREEIPEKKPVPPASDQASLVDVTHTDRAQPF